ncbi:MAG: hypothetical protein EAX91_14925 [Candidatus Lokiarchaeota archaeon]|nr:hypothetical protein [Candidatus Lokiarchaeota archaeon]
MSISLLKIIKTGALRNFRDQRSIHTLVLTSQIHSYISTSFCYSSISLSLVLGFFPGNETLKKFKFKN